MYCSLQGSSVDGLSQARVLELVAISFSRRSSLDLPDPGMKPASPAAQDSLPPRHLGTNYTSKKPTCVPQVLCGLHGCNMFVGEVIPQGKVGDGAQSAPLPPLAAADMALGHRQPVPGWSQRIQTR